MARPGQIKRGHPYRGVRADSVPSGSTLKAHILEITPEKSITINMSSQICLCVYTHLENDPHCKTNPNQEAFGHNIIKKAPERGL
jgi:hypothetical protein